MPGQQQDYLLRQIELLRQFIARLTGGAEPGLQEALQMSYDLQQKLLPLPPPEFLQLELAEQIDALRRHETPAAGHDKVLAYATLLAETASLYDRMGREDLAAGARQMALYAALSADAEQPGKTSARGLIRDLGARLDPGELHPPVAELLAEHRRRSGLNEA